MSSPTARTLRLLRQSGYTADVVERWLPHAGVRKDFLGCIDVLAVRRGEPGVLAIQATTRSNLAARLTKAKGRAELGTWLAAGNRFEVWGWHQVDGRWRVHRTTVSADDLADSVLTVRAPRRRPDRQPLLNFGDT